LVDVGDDDRYDDDDQEEEGDGGAGEDVVAWTKAFDGFDTTSGPGLSVFGGHIGGAVGGLM
jgi:hypothetical protein